MMLTTVATVNISNCILAQWSYVSNLHFQCCALCNSNQHAKPSCYMTSVFVGPERSMVVVQGIEAIRHIPCIAIQGRLDYVCPVNTAYDLHCAWPEMELRIVPNAGHSMYDDSITHELLEATDRLRGYAPSGQQSKSRSSSSSRQYASI